MAEWRLHDLQHTLSTGMHELGIEPHIVESVLNHVSGHKDGVNASALPLVWPRIASSFGLSVVVGRLCSQ
jgi:hypothetical protein